MGIHTPPTNLVPSWLAEHRPAETGHERSDGEDTATESGTAFEVFFAAEVFEIDAVGLESDFALAVACHLHPYVL